MPSFQMHVAPGGVAFQEITVTAANTISGYRFNVGGILRNVVVNYHGQLAGITKLPLRPRVNRKNKSARVFAVHRHPTGKN